MKMRLLHRRIRGNMITLLGASLALTSGACPQTPSGATVPNLQESLDFVRSGLERGFEYERSGEREWSTSTLDYRITAQGSDAVLLVTKTTDSQDCTYTYRSLVKLSALDPNDVHGNDQPWGIFLSVGTTDGKNVVNETEIAASKKEKVECIANKDGYGKELLLRFDDPPYRNRAMKAMRHAIELAGGKNSAF